MSLGATVHISTCRFCGNPITTSGDHQICSLKCGHIFGYKCLLNWFETNSICPICNKPFTFHEIQLLFWPNPVNEKSDRIESIKKENTNYEKQISLLNKRIQFLEKELEEENKKLYKVVPSTKYMVISEQEISQPGIIYQRKLTESSRLFTINHLILNTTRHFNSYGIQISHFDDLQSFSTVNLHTSQIRDLCSDGNTFITASLDQSVSFSSLETESKIADFHFDVPLWSCTQLNDTLIACGGDRGWVYGIDTRSGTRFFERQIVGPPINSMSTCDNTLLFLSAHSINFYDFIKGDFIEVHTNIDGGFSLRKTEDSELFSLIQRQGNNAAMFYCRFERQSVFKMFKMVPMKYFSQIPGTAMRSIDGNVYAAVPNEQSCDISLYTLSQQNNNIWEKWKERWDYEKNNKPILDVAIDAEDSMTVSTLSCDRLTVYQIPIKFV